jgi:uroporphyrin-III C-methyltransferase/precorrin-2 dehydrogenase/sirohydrochlorin ferrochelatase
MRYLPVFVDIVDRRCVIIGGGESAARKLRLLLRAGARPTVLAKAVTDEIAEAARQGKVAVEARKFTPPDLKGAALIIVADASRQDAEAISAAARRSGVLVNVVDQPDLCTAVMPGIVDRDPVLIAIGSAGASPVLVRRLRERIERLLPPRLGELPRFAEQFRAAVAAKVTAGPARRAFWEQVIDGSIGAAVLSGKRSRANEAMLRLINAPVKASPRPGQVALVGAGPGATDLLTLRALRLIQDADVVVHDALVGAEVLDLVRRDADRIDVGKRKGNHRFTQCEINETLLERARAGQRVVRLKGGDPFLFGRGGEELEFLQAQDIDVEVVPGITAALGAAASTGIPLTHRDHASAVTFLTGHGAQDRMTDPSESALGCPLTTAVVYMGLDRAGEIAARAIELGRPRSTPVAVIDKATHPDERVLRGTLARLEELVESAGLRGPTLLIIGEVTGLPASRADTPTLRRAAG